MVNQRAASISYMIMLWKRVYKKKEGERKFREDERAGNYENHLR